MATVAWESTAAHRRVASRTFYLCFLVWQGRDRVPRSVAAVDLGDLGDLGDHGRVAVWASGT